VKPSITVEPAALDFGDVTSGVRKCEVRITNRTAAVVSWDRVETSCDCLSFRADRTTLEPGAVATAEIEFDPSKEPGFRGSLMMTLNTFDSTGKEVFAIQITATLR
jgi:hypothetical protein